MWHLDKCEFSDSVLISVYCNATSGFCCLLLLKFMTINCVFDDVTWTWQHSKILLSHTPRQNEDLCLSAGWKPSNGWSWSSWRHNHLRFFVSGWKTEHRVLLFLLHHLPLLLLLLLLRVNRVSFLPLSPPLWPAACSWNSPAPLIFNLCAY